MSLLNGGLQAIFGAAFGPLYLDGTLHTSTLTVETDGDVTESSPVDLPIKVQVDRCTEAMRQAPDYSAKDVALIVLQKDVTIVPNIEHEITVVTDPDSSPVGSDRYKLNAPIEADAASTHWLIRGTKLG